MHKQFTFLGKQKCRYEDFSVHTDIMPMALTLRSWVAPQRCPLS